MNPSPSSPRLTLLGTGSSGGVPRIGNDWGVCDPNHPRNRRRRCALLIEAMRGPEHTTTVLIDAGVDMREQLLEANVQSLEGVVLTHPHADHMFGLDDLRQMAITLRRPIDVYMDEQTANIVMPAFGYCFKQAPGTSYPPFCRATIMDHRQPVIIDGPGGPVELQPLIAEHGDIHALGFRTGAAVYMPDVKRVSDTASLELLNKLDVLIIDALRRKPHPAHMSLDESLAFIHTCNPARAILTNMHCDLDYQSLCDSLPDGVVPGYDGMSVEVASVTSGTLTNSPSSSAVE